MLGASLPVVKGISGPTTSTAVTRASPNLDHRVREHAEALNVDAHDVAGFQRERRLGDDAGPGEQQRADRKRQGVAEPAASSSNPRFILCVDVSSANTIRSSREISMRILNGATTTSTGTMQGPSEHERSYVLAWGRKRGLSPSMLRDDTSLPTA
jgi:hypothetical protein